jgi:hypothetical protein
MCPMVTLLGKMPHRALPSNIPYQVEELGAQTSVPLKRIIVESPGAALENLKLFSGIFAGFTGTLNRFSQQIIFLKLY